MQQFARGMGFIFLGYGILLAAFPETSRRLVRVRAEFAQLSSGALRLLGVAYAMTGALLVAATVKPEEMVRAGENVPSELRKAA